jgi:inositol-hexakisphosphate/diphosphoinositol-pentakisphosphate 1-kinase
MKEIIARLDPTLFDVVIFGDECILHQPVEQWPIVECLIAFYSTGYPLEKALGYVELRKPYLINDLKTQQDLQDRRKVYEVIITVSLFASLRTLRLSSLTPSSHTHFLSHPQLLARHNIAVPSHVYAERDVPGKSCVVEDFDEWILVNGIKVMKPLVEKPVDADDHNVLPPTSPVCSLSSRPSPSFPPLLHLDPDLLPNERWGRKQKTLPKG